MKKKSLIYNSVSCNSLLTVDSNSESVYGHSAAADGHFIFSRVCGAGVHDGQRSSLIIQLQSVSESPIRTIICGEHFYVFIDSSYLSLLMSKPPCYQILFLYFSNTRF